MEPFVLYSLIQLEKGQQIIEANKGNEILSRWRLNYSSGGGGHKTKEYSGIKKHRDFINLDEAKLAL